MSITYSRSKIRNNIGQGTNDLLGEKFFKQRGLNKRFI